MDKKYLTPVELIQIATQHAYSAEYLLQDNGEIFTKTHELSDTLTPFITLMHMAFELTLKACLLQDYQTNNQHKSLIELLELSSNLGFSAHEIQLIKKLARQFAYRKGVDYEAWEDRQQLHGFCVEIMMFYERLQELIPLELQKDYQ